MFQNGCSSVVLGSMLSTNAQIFILSMSKNVTVNSLGELYEDSKQVHRSFQAPDDTRRTEFTALVQMPKPPQTDGPLLVQDIKRTIQSFVSFNEPGYGVSNLIFFCVLLE